MPNRLANETSPYLLQHKDNPVDWYPWSDEAFARARAEDKPVFLSIGYSACHWCHVMERESFENETIAELMNRNFINIKVDREERPDIDNLYMTAVQTLTGRGGWPMSVFLTPDGRPFHGGTYFPPEDRHGLPGFPRVLQTVADVYHSRRDDVLRASNEITEAIRAQGLARHSAEPLTVDILDAAFRGMEEGFDRVEGGMGQAPKFPQPCTWEFVLRHHHRTGSPQALEMVTLTLRKMARGGMYDQLGGGFHRYAVDGRWLVPHFEKMLYDNALLAPLYLHAWLQTGEPLFRDVVEGTLGYVLREMTDPQGGFYSSQDADSEGEEGKLFVWTPAEIDAVLGPDRGRILRIYYGVTEAGNFEGRNILSVPRSPESVAQELGLPVGDLLAAIEEARPLLLEARSRRVPPATDDKVLVAWNAMMLKAFADCGATLGRPDWVEVARRNADFLLGSLVDGSGRLLRSWRSGSASRLKAYLEDYALLADALLALYEATFEQRWLDHARRLADAMIDLFWDPGSEVFFDTGHDHEGLVVRPRDIFDNATPCGSSAAAAMLLRLSVFAADPDYERRAIASLRSVRDMLDRAPTAFANWLSALDFALARVREVVIIGPPDDPRTSALLGTVRATFDPNRVLAGAPAPVDHAPSPLLAGRTMLDGAPSAYVCENYACQMPVATPEALAEQLRVR
ncbi:MAG TPA: thioredoxin domain-containing protein [Dehalococcoidia bacterium]|nr:thioredoxin domain-containing protein [Dehalococcoidia bacterium]